MENGTGALSDTPWADGPANFLSKIPPTGAPKGPKIHQHLSKMHPKSIKIRCQNRGRKIPKKWGPGFLWDSSSEWIFGWKSVKNVINKSLKNRLRTNIEKVYQKPPKWSQNASQNRCEIEKKRYLEKGRQNTKQTKESNRKSMIFEGSKPRVLLENEVSGAFSTFSEKSNNRY